jgi:hypothetical protein
LRFAGPAKVNHAIHHAVIGESDGWHTQFYGSLGQVVDAAQAVK